jgi:hypothetical protein
MSVAPVTVDGLPTLTLAAGTTGGVAVASTIDPAVDYLLIYTNSAAATQGINRNTLLGLSSAPLGKTDSQTVSNKTLDNSNSYTALDGSFTLENTSDSTKKAVFSLSGITTGTTRTYTLPNYNATLATLAGTETLTNKTLTSPTINSPTITNASITADAITGFTTANTGSIYGMSVTAGVLASAAIAGAVNTAAIASNAVVSGKLGLSSSYTGGVASQSNAGTAGGTMYYINLGGIKLLWLIITASSATSTYTVTFPTGFFSATPVVTTGVAGSSGTTTGQYIVDTVASTGFSWYSGTNPDTGTSFLVIGS